MGVEAPVFLHDIGQRRVLHKLALLRSKVQAVDFSCDEKYLVTLGGEDDGNLAIWDVVTGKALAGSPAATAFVHCLAFYNRCPTKFVTAGQNNLRIWEFDASIHKLHYTEVALGTTTRIFTQLQIDPSDTLLYAGTSTGDVIQVNLASAKLRNSGPAKGAVSQGISSLLLLAKENKMVCGGGTGSLAVLAVDTNLSADPKTLKKFGTVASAQISEHALTSLVLDHTQASSGSRHVMYCATAGSELYKVVLDLATRSVTKELLQTAHCGKINDLAFPHGYAEVCATSSKGTIRVWHLPTLRELLRMDVPHVDCKALAFTQSGKLLWTINDAHPLGVSALACTPDSARIVSGGEDGTVRGPVNCIAMKEDGSQCSSASSDGSAIVWDLRTCKRVKQLLDNTFFKAFCFHPEGSEFVTAGSNKQITYWCGRSAAGEVLRRLEATQGDSMNCLVLSGDGHAMVSGSSDRLVKVWGFDDGRCYFVGAAHSAPVTQVKVTYDKKHIVSVGADGAVMVWRYKEPATPHA
ncbi:hypothetical protein N2152v2_009392 [Parachlorella kessleri]